MKEGVFMTYEQIRHRVPEGIPKKIKKVRPIGPKNAVIFFLVLMALIVVIGSLIQLALGMVGVMITELFFLIASILYVRRRGVPLKDVFPIKKPKVSAIFGTLILWGGAYILMILSNLVMLVFFPEIPANADAETIMSADLSWLFLFIIVAVLPPICEEAMHRGVIQYGFRQKISNPWVMAFVIGLIFGIFHLDPSKFLATGLLGGVMAWILHRSGNMVYSSLFHFVHNGAQMVLLLFIPALAFTPGTLIVPGTAMAEGILKLATVPFAADVSITVSGAAMQAIGAGITMAFLGAILPFVLYTGDWLLMLKIAPRRHAFLPEEKNMRKSLLKKLFGFAAVFMVAGVLLAVFGVAIA